MGTAWGRAPGSTRGSIRDAALAAAGLVALLASPVLAVDALLGWTPVQRAAGYRLYVRQIGQAYRGTDVGLLQPGNDGIVRYITRGLPLDVTNSFAVSAYDSSGRESALSNEISLLVSSTPGAATTPTAGTSPIAMPTASPTTSSGTSTVTASSGTSTATALVPATALVTRTPSPVRVVEANCAATPVPGCLAPGKSKLVLSRPGGNGKLLWQWLKGAATTFDDLGDPVNGVSDYRLCIYDEATGIPRLALAASAPAGNTYWKKTGTATWSGFKYRSADLAPDGLQIIRLKAARAGKARITVVGRGANLPLTLPFTQDTDVIVQLSRSDGGVCWQTTYSAPADKNSDTQFKDRP